MTSLPGNTENARAIGRSMGWLLIRRGLNSFLVITLVAACCANGQNKPADSTRIVHVQMRNVMYHFTDEIAVHLRMVAGDLVPAAGNEFPIFDDKNSFTLRLKSAEI